MLGASKGIARKGLMGRFLIGSMALGFAALIAIGFAAFFTLNNAQRHTSALIHSYQVESTIADIGRLVEQAETSRRGYMLSGRASFLTTHARAAGAIPVAVDRFAALTRDNPRQQELVAGVRGNLRTLLAEHARTNALVRAGRGSAALARFRAQTGAHIVLALRENFAAMNADERRLLAYRATERASSERVFYIVLVAGVVVFVLVALASLLTILRYTRDLAASRDELGLLNETLEDQVEERTADLALANEEIQRFAYIVSHDLRSPLVNVMGFTAELSAATAPLAELVTRAEAEAPHIVTEDARLAAREDLPESIRFIRTSTAKMDRLINAILKLSREGRRTIAPEPLDPAALVDTIIASIQHVIDERGVTVIVRRPMPRIVTDRLAIEQILSNLIENATKYLQPGRAGQVTVSAVRDRARVIISVADNGRGIDPRDHQRIFDLFRRSGQQDQPGEGIGLAHVRALAYRLGGTIAVESQLGQGATFHLSLPSTLHQDVPAS
ncbi:CHASE3 domain-containing protein [Sphingomonas sp. NY01]|uniref:sensor histidine kinase n=1 Tax=Sphingomonas sp. NY01 TaxID=2968057 RepID=UPI00315DC33A